MQATTLATTDCAINDQRGHRDQIAQLEQLRRNFEVPIKFLNLCMQVAQARGCALLQLAFPVEDVDTRAFLAACGFGAGETLSLHL